VDLLNSWWSRAEITAVHARGRWGIVAAMRSTTPISEILCVRGARLTLVGTCLLGGCFSPGPDIATSGGTAMTGTAEMDTANVTSSTTTSGTNTSTSSMGDQSGSSDPVTTTNTADLPTQCPRVVHGPVYLARCVHLAVHRRERQQVRHGSVFVL